MKLHYSIHANFDALAARCADAIALIGADRQLSFGELARRSDGIARYLQRHGIVRGDRVGLFTQRSVDAVAAMLGILKAGGTYVPFDPSYPPKLLKYVHDDCRPALMLVQSSLVTADDSAFWEGAGHELSTVVNTGCDEQAAGPLPDIGPDDPAYIMYTSGSTGHPKGVLIPHRGVVRLVTHNPYAAMGPDEVHLQLAPLAFDASTFEIWGALLNGGKLAIVSSSHPSLDDIASSIARHAVTTLWLTAGLFHLMVDHRLDGLKPLRQLLAGGDVLSPTHIAKAQAALPDCQLINGYGPTENTTFTCCYRIPRGAADALRPTPAAAIPIGTAIAHTRVYILDESRREVADGQEGELFTGGAGVALGYWQRPELSAEKFVADPYVPGGLALMYRTGDRVRRRADGNIEFLGRVDRQVKINGKRVELDEIEATLRRGPTVEDAAAVCPPGDVGARKVHAYVKFRGADAPGVAAPGVAAAGVATPLEALREFLKQELPDYMVPATLTVLDTLPLSPTGKIDRSKLPLPRAVAAGGTAAVDASAPAGNEIEATVLEIWQQILATKSIGFEDNFFDLGGTSLQLIAVHARIVAAMNTDISVVDLFQYPSIGALAARLVRGAAAPGIANAPRQTPAASQRSGTGSGSGGSMNADERARRLKATLDRARANPRRNAR